MGFLDVSGVSKVAVKLLSLPPQTESRVFLVACYATLYVTMSVGWSVGRSIGWLVGPSVGRFVGRFVCRSQVSIFLGFTS